MDGRQKTAAFLSELDEDLLIYEHELKKRGFTSSASLKYLRENDLEEIGMAEGHKRLLMNAVSKLQSPQISQQLLMKESKSTSAKKRRLPFEQIATAGSSANFVNFVNEELLLGDDGRGPQPVSQGNIFDIRHLSSKQVPTHASTSGIETPVQRLLRHKRDEIGKLREELQEKNVNIKEFLSGIHEAQEENMTGQSSPACGQCHLRIGHTRRNCSLSPCKSVYSCGLIDKHPDQKQQKKALENQKTQLQRKIAKLQAEHDSYAKAKTSVENSKAKGIENELLSACPSRYISANGNKNWMLLNKDVALLEKKINIKEYGLPDRRSIMTLLNNAIEENSLPQRSNLTRNIHDNENPKRRALEDHGIQFPRARGSLASSSTSTSQSATSDIENPELGDFALAVSLQNEECQEYNDKQQMYEAASSLMDMSNEMNNMQQ